MEYRTKRLTMQDIADMAQVDKAVVSQIVNNADVIHASREKAERVREIIRKYRYTPLSSAQSLATRCTRQIAFLLSVYSRSVIFFSSLIPFDDVYCLTESVAPAPNFVFSVESLREPLCGGFAER